MVGGIERGYDLLGNVAIVKFSKGVSSKMKKKFAFNLMKERKMITSVLEKVGKFSGRLRTLRTRWIAGEKNKEVLYRENNCVFRFNTDSCYFSPRLATERLEIAKMTRTGEKVLVLFGGVGPFAIVISKCGRAEKVVSIELSRKCNKYALENVRRNKLSNVEIVQGDVRRVLPKMNGEKYDRIVMARPNLKDTFLDVALPLIRKNGIIHYYGFCREDELEGMQEVIKRECKNAGKKIKVLKIKRAGDIGVRTFRYRVDMKVLN